MMIEYNVYFLAVNAHESQWVPISRVKHRLAFRGVSAGIVVKNPVATYVTSALESMTNSIIDDIAVQITNFGYDEPLISKVVGPRDDPMEYLMVGFTKYRRCMVFYVFQRSAITNKVRLMAYGIDHAAHSGAGTSLELLDDEAVKKKLNEILLEIDASRIEASKELRDAIINGNYTMFVPLPS